MTLKNSKPVTDEQLVDYLLKALPENEEAHIARCLEATPSLSARYHYWETILAQFSLDEKVGEVKPPQKVWQQINTRLFEVEQSVARTRQSVFWRYLLPAFLSLMLLFFGGYYFTHQPTYYAQIVTDKQTVWQIEGNPKSIRFISLTDIAVEGQHCVAWLLKPNGVSQKLGVIPDTGERVNRRIALPEHLATAPGDKIVIAMVESTYQGRQIPQQVPTMSTVLTTEI